MLRRLKILALLLITSVATVVHGYNGCFGDYLEFSGEWLYMLASMEQPEFVIDSAVGSIADGPRVANDQSWHSGYRAEVVWGFCDCLNELSVRWTRFPGFTEKKKVVGQNQFPILNHPRDAIENEPGTAEIGDHYSFYFLDALFSREVISCPRLSVAVQVGAQYSYLSLREDVFYNDDFEAGGIVRFIEIRSRLKGIGPELGLQGQYRFCDFLALTGRINNGWLVSNFDSSFEDISIPAAWGTNGIVAQVKNSDYWRVIPTLDLRFGLNYSALSCPCPWINRLKLEIEAGYEIITFFKGIDRIYFMDRKAYGVSIDELITFTMHGPYVHLGVIF